MRRTSKQTLRNPQSASALAMAMAMREDGNSDAVLLEDGAEYLELLAKYGESCAVAERMETAWAGTRETGALRPYMVDSARRMGSALQRIGRTDAQTEAGILAKCRVMQGYFHEHPVEDIRLMTLLDSLVGDVERWVSASNR